MIAITHDIGHQRCIHQKKELFAQALNHDINYTKSRYYINLDGAAKLNRETEAGCRYSQT